MQQQGPKRRSTQLGMGESGLHPRAGDEKAATTPPADPAASHALQCPSPSSPPRRTASSEHGTVEFSGEPMRTRAPSVVVAESERAREEAARSDSVRARLTARRETEPAMAPVSASPARVPREDVEADGAHRREERVDLVPSTRPERSGTKSGPPETLRAGDARPGSAPPRRVTDQHIRAARETIKKLTTWDIDEPATGRVARPGSAPPASDRRPPSGSERAAVRVDDVGANAVRLAARAVGDPIPKVLVQRRALASAPIDHREAFLVSLIDGTLTVSALVDVSGMPAGEVSTALQRLARLGIVAL